MVVLQHCDCILALFNVGFWDLIVCLDPEMGTCDVRFNNQVKTEKHPIGMSTHKCVLSFYMEINKTMANNKAQI